MSPLSPEVLVALAIGLPSFVIAVLSLWLAYLSYADTRRRHQERIQQTFTLPAFMVRKYNMCRSSIRTDLTDARKEPIPAAGSYHWSGLSEDTAASTGARIRVRDEGRYQRPEHAQWSQPTRG